MRDAESELEDAYQKAVDSVFVAYRKDVKFTAKILVDEVTAESDAEGYSKEEFFEELSARTREMAWNCAQAYWFALATVIGTENYGLEDFAFNLGPTVETLEEVDSGWRVLVAMANEFYFRDLMNEALDIMKEKGE